MTPKTKLKVKIFVGSLLVTVICLFLLSLFDREDNSVLNWLFWLPLIITLYIAGELLFGSLLDAFTKGEASSIGTEPAPLLPTISALFVFLLLLGAIAFVVHFLN